MKRETTVCIRDKEIINLCDGCRLGYATDFEINVCDGKITALIIPGGFRLLGFGKKVLKFLCRCSYPKGMVLLLPRILQHI